MIKVNLLQARGAGTATGQAVSEGTSTEVLGSTAATLSKALNNEFTKPAIINLLVILSVPGSLIFYERHTVEKLKQDTAAINRKITKLEADAKSKKTEVGKSAELTDRAKELTAKLDIIRKLSRIRLREIKVLDFIQTTVPEKVWLRDLVIDQGELAIKGYAATDDDLTLFVRSLEKSRNFSNVLLLVAKEERTKERTVKSFEISGTVEAE